MVCIYCHSDLQVINSRPQRSKNTIWRRRRCKQCQTVFTSIETLDLSNSLRVKTPDGLEPFIIEKLITSLYESLKHSQGASENAKAIADTVCHHVLSDNSQLPVIEVQRLIAITGQTLQAFNEVAGLHYLARYKHRH